jgi:uncharacterized membrane protein YbhN (UPF0104 family)
VKFHRFTPIIISLILVAILVGYAPWAEVLDAIRDCPPSVIAILGLLSLLYYALKSLRFWLLLRAMDIRQPLKTVALSYMSAQPVSLLPAGEVYRSHQLKKYTGVPLSESIPQFTMQGVLEGVSMVSLALISALALRTLRLPFLALTIVLIAVVLAIRRGHVASISRALNRLPFFNVNSSTIDSLNYKHQAVLNRNKLPLLLAISITTELVGAAIAYFAVVGVGAHINIYQSILLYVIPVIVGFVSLLPGGLGISEQSAVGILLLADIPIAEAVGSTLLMRCTLVVLGVAYGGLALILGRKLKPAKAQEV